MNDDKEENVFDLAKEVKRTTGSSEFVPPDPEALQVEFRNIEVLELIGRGGMGAVYKAREVDLDRFVALKILPVEHAGRPGLADRFKREAQAMAKLEHPNIVPVYSFGQTGAGLFYIVMAYVDGTTLQTVLDSGPLAADQGLAMVSQICDALQYSHRQGVVHRDIKPGNIMLTRTGQVKITDFGLAKLFGHRAEACGTMSGATLGTPYYMAPEQVGDSGKIDHRVDIYALGVLFYEMLTGHLPTGAFEPPSEKVGVDARVDAVVLKALQREPERRYQQASEVVDDLRGIKGRNSGETGRTPRSRSASAFGILAVCILLVGVVVVMAWPRERGRNNVAGDGSVPEQPPGARLPHRNSTTIGTGSDARIGFELQADIPTYSESRPTLIVGRPSNPASEYQVSRLFWYKEADSGVAMDGDAKFWVVAPDGPFSQASALEEPRTDDALHVRPTRSLPDGVYCLHLGSLNGAMKSPEFSAPFVVRGYGLPELVGTSVKVTDDGIEFELSVRNAGKGAFNDGFVVLTIQQKETGSRSQFKGRTHLEFDGPIPPGESATVRTTWSRYGLGEGAYFFAAT